MPVQVDLTDSEGVLWDIRSSANGNPELGIDGGLDTQDPFDGGLRLRVNGVAVNPDNASVDGREVNTQPVVIGGIAVQRSILVSDAGVSATGFARFLDSFTNTTGAEVTITVETITDSGADANLQFPITSSGDTVLDGSDAGFTTSDGGAANDSRVMIAYGDGSLAPTDTTVSGDTVTVTHTITLAPGETRSLLQFATQNNSDGDATSDLTAFTQNAAGLQLVGALAGLSREEMLSIVNYGDFDLLLDPFELRDSEGNLWTIGLNGTISSADGALNDFNLPVFTGNFTVVTGAEVNAAENSVTVSNVSEPFGPEGTVTYEYTALEDLGVIRLLVTLDLTTSAGGFSPFGFTQLATGPNGSQLVAQVNGSFNNQVTGVVIDDSISGSGGTVPAATVVWGAINAGDSFTLLADTLLNNNGDFGLAGGQIHTFLYFLAVNDTGNAALADLTRLAAPGPELLAYMSAAEVAALRNFDIAEFQGRLQEVLGADGVDDVITGQRWGDSIVSGSGDDEIASLGSDDIVRGGIGDDLIDGGDGDDSLFGGVDNDDITGGFGADQMFGEDGSDHMAGQSGDDSMFGGNGGDRLSGWSGNDSLSGGLDADTLRGNTGADTLNGEDGADELSGGANGDQMSGGADADRMFGGNGLDTMNGDAGADLMEGGDGADIMSGGLDADTLRGDGGKDTLTGDDGNDSLEGGDDADSLTGGNNDDALSGGRGGDRLFGGAGADSLTGGGADDNGTNRLTGGQDGDSYFVNSGADLVIENANGGGTDTVFSTITYALTDNVENLVLLNGAADGTGNTLANRLTGNGSGNFLDGRGGADTMEGGLGDDLYNVDDAGDVVTELGGTTQGTDTVQSLLDFTLGDSVENLFLLGGAGISGTGNAAANVITGNGGDNAIIGGLGNDTLTGGLGRDIFVFNTATGPQNVDQLTDFRAGKDVMQLDNDIFTGLAAGRPNARVFVNGTVALDGNDRLLYDVATGTLRYDADGIGTTESVIIAVLENSAALTNDSFFVI